MALRTSTAESRPPRSSPMCFHDALVNLTVFDSHGVPHSRTSVPLVQADEPKPTWLFLRMDAVPGGAGGEAFQTGISGLVALAMSVDRSKADLALGCAEVCI